MSVLQFSELKQFLTSGVPSVLVLFGKDDYLKKNAIDLVKKQINLSYADLNICKVEEFDAKRIVNECNTLPFLDSKRLVVCYLPEKLTTKDLQALVDYSGQPCEWSVLVVVAGIEKPKTEFGTFVDCGFLDLKTLTNWLAVSAKKRNVSFELGAKEEILERTNLQMFRIRSEFEKLASFVGDGGTITKAMVRDNVAPEYEYQVFVFADLVAKGEKEKALKMMEDILLFEKNILGAWSVLYGHFRRMFYAKISKESSRELADALGVKEFAVAKAKKQAESFGARELKQILEIIANTEIAVKMGKMNQDIAIKTGLVSILNTRG